MGYGETYASGEGWFVEEESSEEAVVGTRETRQRAAYASGMRNPPDAVEMIFFSTREHTTYTRSQTQSR